MSQTCPGSGTKRLRKDSYRNKVVVGWIVSNEGWRTVCPVCGKDCSVTPSGQVIQKHSWPTPKLTKAEKAAEKQASLNSLYAEIYECGAAGDSLRPTGDHIDAWEMDTWIMAYMDGLADSGHNMKLGAFKRWLAKN